MEAGGDNPHMKDSDAGVARTKEEEMKIDGTPPIWNIMLHILHLKSWEGCEPDPMSGEFAS